MSQDKNQETEGLVSPTANFDFEYRNLPPKGSKRKVKYIDRKIVSGRVDPKLPDNGISTGKYNFITFLPKNLMEQFSKIANIYFLIIGVMQSIKTISVSNGKPDIFLPLFVIVIISAFKDLFEDIKRHRSDNEENAKKVKVLDPETGKLNVRTWKSLQVGEIVKIDKNEYIPADLLILVTSDPKGEAFIETKNLDGETNMKHKLIPKTLLKTFGIPKEEFNYNQRIIFNYEAPNPYLYTFNGSVTTEKKEKIPIDVNNFVLRGCSLRNTNYIYGLVAYTGHDTKIMLNSVKARQKKSKVERMMGTQILIIFGFQTVLCLFCSIFYSVWLQDNEYDLSYLLMDIGTKDTELAYNIGTRFGNWMIIFSNFVPISLLVTLEMVKFIQGIMISKDPDMFHKDTNTPTNVQSSNLNEELGQVEYVFSDKTGTLTQNNMEFRKLVAKGKPYGLDQSVKDISKYTPVTNVNFRDKTFFDALSKNDPGVDEYLMSLAICHTIITETKDGEIIYNASSPDELALVNFAKFVGCEYTGNDAEGCMTITFKKKEYKFKLHQVLEFNSKRKRMSVIVEDQKGQILLYCKGADSILLDLMQKGQNPDIDITMHHLMEFADEGLRTLLVASKVIPKSEYEAWAKRYLSACISTDNRQDKMEKLQEEIEKGISLIGATAIEDKLQDEVGSTIAFLKKAGIKVWVLTGDKIETAINIGFSCNLLNKDLERLIVDGKGNEEVSRALQEAQQLVDLRKVEKKPMKFALIVSGDALIQAMQEPLSTQVMHIANDCEAVLCCRVAPKQKAEVVTLVRKTNPTVSTLAIGDGANDVNMITAAHVGIGIRGVEGQQAARASDYAIGEFKLLKKLLVYHGRESYRKNCTLILFNFFKNIVLALPIFWIGFDMVFSGTSVYESWLYSLFNVFFASLPIVIYAIVDQEFRDDSLMKYPFLYAKGLFGELFNGKRFWLWFLNAVIQSVIIGMLSLYILDSNFITNKGYDFDVWGTGALILGLCVVVANFKILTFSHNYCIFSVFIIFGSIGVYIIAFFVVNFMSSSDLYDAFVDIFSIPTFYFANFVIIVACSFKDLAQESYFGIIEHKEIEKKKRDYDTDKLAPPVYIFSGNDSEMPMSAKSFLSSSRPESIHDDHSRTSGIPQKITLFPFNELTPEQGSIKRHNKFSRAHTGYAFSEEERENRFKPGRGHDHPQN